MTPERRQQFQWALYDWANSAFATTVMAGLFPIFFKQYWHQGVDAQTSTFHLGLGNSIASIIVLFLAPILGALADGGLGKKRLLALFMLLGVAGTAGLYFVPQGEWRWALGLFVIGTLGFAGGMVFYDALLVDVATPQDSDRVSALGYGLGYLGGGILFALNVAMTLKPELFGLSGKTQAVQFAFLTVAGWWLLFSLPLLTRVRERRAPSQAAWFRAVPLAFRQLWITAGHLRRDRTVMMFLLAYWLYIDGVDTIIKMAVDFGLALGFPDSSLIVALLLVQFVGFPAAIAFGYLGNRLGTKRAIFLGLAVYIGVTFWAYFLQTVTQFYAMALTIGLVQGGVQALSRSFYSRLIPAQRAAEYFGFYNMLGKFAAIIGPILVGWSAVVTSSSRVSILSILVLFIGGAWLLSRVQEPRVRAA